jgi:hypothetical protein
MMTDVGRSPALERLMLSSGWREERCAEPVYRLTWRPPFVVQSGQLERRVLLRGRPGAAVPPERPLIQLTPEVAAQAGINPTLTTPYGLEQLSGRTIAWLGPGPAGGLGAVLWAEAPLRVRVSLELAAGPGRADLRRSVVVLLRGEPQAGGAITFDQGTRVSFGAQLQPGVNPLSIRVLGNAPPRPPGADPRTLMVLVQDVLFAAAP